MFQWLLIVGLTLAQVSYSEELGQPEQQIVGCWKFYKVLYNGKERPPFNEELQLYFEFTSDQQSRLFYYRSNKSGFCERRGEYRVDSATRLTDEVIWVNPKNMVGCGQDPDMKMGNKTTTPIRFENDDFYLQLSLKGEPLFYIWHRAECSFEQSSN